MTQTERKLEELEGRVAVLEQLALADCPPIETKSLPDDLKAFDGNSGPDKEPEESQVTGGGQLPEQSTGETLV